MKLSFTDLLKYYNQLSNAIFIYNQDSHFLDEEVYKEISCLHEALKSIFPTKKSARFDWMDESVTIEVDSELYDQIIQKSAFLKEKKDKRFDLLTHIFNTLFELIQTERTFVNLCQSINVAETQKAYVSYIKIKFGEENSSSAEYIKKVSHALAKIKDFKKVTNFLEIDHTVIPQCAEDLTYFLNKIFNVVGKLDFSMQQQELLVKLANNYWQISECFNGMNNDIYGYKSLSPKEKKLISGFPDVISTPFQRIGRYHLIFAEVVKSFSELCKKMKFDDSVGITTNSMNEAFKRRVAFANECIGQPEIPTLRKVTFLERPVPDRKELGSKPNQFPASYERLFSRGEGNISDNPPRHTGLISIFGDYCAYKINYLKGFEKLNLHLFFHGHWNRHHIDTVQYVMNFYEPREGEEGGDIVGFLHFLKSKLLQAEKQINPKGSLAKRIAFVQEKIGQDIIDINEINDQIIASKRRKRNTILFINSA